MAKVAKRMAEPRQEIDDRGRVPAERLFQAEVRRPAPEITGGQELERVRRGLVVVRPSRYVLDRVDDEIEVDESRRHVGLEAAGRGPEDRRELFGREGRLPELSRQAAA